MNFEQLREVIKNIKSRLACTGCESNFRNEDIFVVSSIADKCLLLINCHECGTPILVTASLNTGGIKINDNMNSNIKKYGTDNDSYVSSDDVLNIHSFLKNFDGDFNNIIKTNLNK